MDGKAVPEDLGGQFGIEGGVLIPGVLFGVVLLGLLLGGENHLTDVGDGLDGALKGLPLLPGQAFVHKGQELVVLLQLAQLPLQIQGHKGEGPHDDKAGHDHKDRGEGHEAVGEDGAKPFGKIIAQIM